VSLFCSLGSEFDGVVQGHHITTTPVDVVHKKDSIDAPVINYTILSAIKLKPCPPVGDGRLSEAAKMRGLVGPGPFCRGSEIQFPTCHGVGVGSVSENGIGRFLPSWTEGDRRRSPSPIACEINYFLRHGTDRAKFSSWHETLNTPLHTRIMHAGLGK